MWGKPTFSHVLTFLADRSWVSIKPCTVHRNNVLDNCVITVWWHRNRTKFVQKWRFSCCTQSSITVKKVDNFSPTIGRVSRALQQRFRCTLMHIKTQIGHKTGKPHLCCCTSWIHQPSNTIMNSNLVGWSVILKRTCCIYKKNPLIWASATLISEI